MASTHFTTGTTITSEWLNDVNDAVYEGNITAEGVQYTPPFTSGVTETVEAKLAQYISVKDFGAVGDGVTDDTVAIQNALDSASSIYFPEGIYVIKQSITVSSNSYVFGCGAASVIKLQADNIIGFTTGTTTSKQNIVIKDLLIDGGGQTTDIYSGYKANIGITLNFVTNAKVDNVIVKNMGVINQASPATDGAYGGMGIVVSADYGYTNNIRINNCTVYNIAGGGYYKGDGIDVIGGYNSGAGIAYMDVVISNCHVSTVGRHCYTVEGDVASLIPSGVKIINCYGEKSALSWLDLEEGRDVLVDGCTMYYCGNDQTYYNPASVYGSTYRLMAGVASGNACVNISVTNSHLQHCYFGINYGATSDFEISNTKIEQSYYSDLFTGLASAPYNLKLTDVICASTGLTNGMQFYNPSSDCGFSAYGCAFFSPVSINAMSGGAFDGCAFNAGFVINGGAAGFARNKISSCQFNVTSGVALDASLSGAAHPLNIIDGCTFRSTGSATIGIAFGYNSAIDWKISNSTFNGFSTAGINHTNGNAVHAFDALNNTFNGCVNGIQVTQAIIGGIISNNYFENIAGYCISINGIQSGSDMIPGPTIIGNISGASCVNGVQIGVTTGSYNYTIITNNNMHTCSSSKWNLASGNANGVVANNITT